MTTTTIASTSTTQSTTTGSTSISTSTESSTIPTTTGTTTESTTTPATTASTTTGTTTESTTTPATTASTTTGSTATVSTSESSTTSSSTGSTATPPTASTTPAVGGTAPPPVPENLFDVKYQSTSNHVFKAEPPDKLTDFASGEDFLKKMINEKVSNRLNASGQSFTVTEGVTETSRKAIVLDGVSNCIQLFNISEDAPIAKTCLLTPSSCQRGISASLWVRFKTTDNYVEEVFYGTGDEKQGVTFKFQSGFLKLIVVGDLKKWEAETSFQKTDVHTKKWTLFGFTWDRFTGKVVFVVDSGTFPIDSVQSSFTTPVMSPTFLHLGCGLSDSGTRKSFLNAVILDPTIWYWPVRLYQLLLGDTVRLMVVLDTVTQVPLPTTQPVIEKDYSYSLTDYPDKGNSDENPLYAVADFYYKLHVSDITASKNLESDTLRKRSGVKLKDTYANGVVATCYNKCPCNYTMCEEGFSLSVWLKIPEVPADGLLLVLQGSASIGIHGGKYNVLLKDRSYLAGTVVAGKTVNFAITAKGERLDIYVNGHLVSKSLGGPSPKSGVIQAAEQSILVGIFSNINYTSGGASLSDLVIWKRKLFPLEIHRFFGYTREQYVMMYHGSMYWTADPWVNADMQAMSEYEGHLYKGNSLYQLSQRENKKFELDRWSKSQSPVLNNDAKDFFVLGNGVTPPTKTSISQGKRCLTDTLQCFGARPGLTASIWMKIRSVSDSKQRIFFNTGSMKDSELDSKGFSIYTDQSLLVLRVTADDVWTIRTDSNTYKIGEWMNFAWTWSPLKTGPWVGSKLFLNGIDYNIQTMTSTISSSRGYDDNRRRAMIGCFDDDNVFSLQATSGQSLWEMADMVFGDVVYKEGNMDIEEYRKMTGLEDANRFYLLANFRRQATSLIDLPYLSLKFAKDKNLKIGPFGTIEWAPTERTVKISNGTLIFGHFHNECPADLSKCSDGISVGGWFRARGSLTPESTFTYFSIGNQDDKKDSLGLKLMPDKKLQGWVHMNGKNWTASLSLSKIQNEWQHYGLVFSKNNGLRLFLNSRLLAEQKTVSTSFTSETAASTDIRSIWSGHDSNVVSPMVMDMFNIVIFQESLEEQQVNKLMGVKSSHMKLLKGADIYFTFSGLYKDLKTPKPVISSTMVSERDKADDVNAAYCTKGDGSSNIDLGNVDHTCLFDPTNCTSYILTINLKLENGSGVVLSSGSKPGNVGLSIVLFPNNTLSFDVRSPTQHYWIQSKALMYRWFQLQFLFNVEGLRVKSNGEDSAYLKDSRITTESNRVPAKHSLTFGLNSDGTGQSGTAQKAVMCVSDISASFYTEHVDIDAIANSMLEVSCYKDTDLQFHMKGNKTDHRGMALASDFSSMSTAVDDQQKNKCFSDPSRCSRGLTVSQWVKIDGGTEGYIMTTGPPSDRGVSFTAKLTDGSYDIEAVVQDGNMAWTAKAGGVIAKSKWVNIGITWAASTSLNLLIDGKAVARDSGGKPLAIAADSSGLVIVGRKTLNEAPTLTAVTADLTVWYSIKADCKFIFQSKVALGGICNAQAPNTTEDGHCNLQANCKVGYGELCLDGTEMNLLAMGKQNVKLRTTTEVSKVVKNVLNKVPVDSDDTLVAKASVISNIGNNWNVPSSFEDDAEANTALDDLFVAIDDTFQESNKDKWKSIVDQTKANPITEMNSLEGLFTRIADNLKAPCVIYPKSSKTLKSYMKKIDVGGCTAAPQAFNLDWDTESIKIKIPWKAVEKSASRNGGKSNLAVLTYKTAHLFLSSQSTNDTSIDTRTNQTVSSFIVNSRITTIGIHPNLSGLASTEMLFFQVPLQEPNKYHEETVGSNNKKQLELFTTFVAWDNSRVDGSADGKGLFSSAGCQIESQDAKTVNASCNHATSFAILMQPVPPDTGAVHRLILKILTYVGICLSLFCLLLFFCLILFRKELSGERYIIHLNLCVAMFAAQFSFVLIEAVKSNEISCRAIGICMHLFFTASFAWLFVESLFSFYAVTAGIVKGRLKCYLPFAWGVPIVVVGTTAGIDINAYGGKNCWLSPNNYFIWAFLGPILAFIFFTTLLCGIVACNIKTPALKKPKVIDQLKSHSKQTACVIPLMMFAWVFGALLVHSYSLPVEYIFVIFNAPQGLWVFLCFGVGNPEVKAILCRRKPNSVADSQQWENVNTRKTGGLTFHSSSPPATFRSTRSLVSSSGSESPPESSRRNLPPRAPPSARSVRSDQAQLEGPSDTFDAAEYPGAAPF